MTALLLLLAGPASAGLLQIEGFVSPRFSATVRPDAVPEDRLTVGLAGSSAGITFSGEPAEQWRFKTYLRVGSDTFDAVTGVGTVDRDNDGAVDGVTTTTRGALGQIVREASITWAPREVFGVRIGRMPIPFTSAAQSPDTALLFPDRAGPNAAFLADDDLGGLGELNLGGRLLASAGLFNGTGVGAGSTSDLGVLYLGRVDVNPLGDFDFDETDPLSSELRVGVGAGVIYNPYTSYDAAGYADVQFSDLRGSVSFRMAVAGLSVAVEALRRYQTDSLTQRPVEATGAYGQAGWYLPMGLEPIFRLGWAVEDQSFDPRQTVWTDAGFNLYPVQEEGSKDTVKLTAQYISESRVTELETARGLSVQAQIKW